MANTAHFESWVGRWLRPADARNSEMAPAYALAPKEALAQYAMTGCLRGTFYAGAGAQLSTVLGLCGQVEARFVARLAVLSRERGHMKHLPALLCAVLAGRRDPYLDAVFPRVIDSARMLRAFVQAVRSGHAGRKSLGTRPRRLVRDWLSSRSDSAVFRGAVGRRPSLADVIRLAHPRPASPARAALHAYLLGRAFDEAALPAVVREFESFKRDPERPVPDVPFERLTALALTGRHWAAIAETASWQATRLNLNTFARHGAFDVPGVAARVAARLSDPGAVARAHVQPHAILVALACCEARVPAPVRAALESALELSLANVPRLEGDVVICPDVSGSMSSPVSGRFGGATTAVRCVDVAALFTAALLRANPTATVLPFADDVRAVRVAPSDSLPVIARTIASRLGGGTNCSAPLALLERRRRAPDLLVLVSDNESWMDARRSGPTNLLLRWERLRSRNPRARLVCVDLQPNGTTPAHGRVDVLNVGGLSDEVFGAIARFTRPESPSTWVETIERVEL